MSLILRISANGQSSIKNAAIDWWCPACMGTFQKVLQYFLTENCHCPFCGAPLNMRVLRQRLGDFIAAPRASPRRIRARRRCHEREISPG